MCDVPNIKQMSFIAIKKGQYYVDFTSRYGTMGRGQSGALAPQKTVQPPQQPPTENMYDIIKS